MLGKGELSEIASLAGDDVVDGRVVEESVDAASGCRGSFGCGTRESAGGSAAVLGV